MRHPVFAWLAADVLSKIEVKVSGTIAYQNLTGRPYRGYMTDFGRQVLYCVNGQRGGYMRPR